MEDNFSNQNRPAGSFDPVRGHDDTSGMYVGRRRHRRSPGSRLFGAIFLIGAGVLLFLDNVGVLPIRNIWDYWPLILIGIGIAKFLGCRSNSQRLVGVLLVGFGSLFLLMNLGVLHIHTRDGSWPLALLLIAFGLIALVKTVESTAGRPRVGFPRVSPGFSESSLDEHAMGGHVKRKLDTPNFAGGNLHCVFGNIEIDLRRAEISSTDKSAIVDVDCVFGAIHIRAPETWRVNVQATGVLGNVEDKTIPPRSVGGIDPPVLIITGQAVFASVEVEN